MQQLYGLIGYPLTHSFSPGYFNKKFQEGGIDAVYKAFELKSINELPRLLNTYSQLKGLNVTIPYKQEVIPYLNSLDEAAEEIGAVNCIAFEQGSLKGYNTDILGFELSLNPLLQPHHNRALVLGTGGSSKAVKYVLRKLGIPYLSVSRNKDEDTITYDELNEELINKHTLIINTTPLGMHPHVDDYPPIPYQFITNQHLLYDLIYNPQETKFLSLGKARGAAVKNGLEMLHLQAEESWRIWNS